MVVLATATKQKRPGIRTFPRGSGRQREALTALCNSRSGDGCGIGLTVKLPWEQVYRRQLTQAPVGQLLAYWLSPSPRRRPLEHCLRDVLARRFDPVADTPRARHDLTGSGFGSGLNSSGV
jgi:hypothetical protein